jgi:hypothetical protein
MLGRAVLIAVSVSGVTAGITKTFFFGSMYDGLIARETAAYGECRFFFFFGSVLWNDRKKEGERI